MAGRSVLVGGGFCAVHFQGNSSFLILSAAVVLDIWFRDSWGVPEISARVYKVQIIRILRHFFLFHFYFFMNMQ